jgi:hypothetical protein
VPGAHTLVVLMSQLKWMTLARYSRRQAGRYMDGLWQEAPEVIPILSFLSTIYPRNNLCIYIDDYTTYSG